MTYPVPLPLPTFSISPLSTISLRVRSIVLRLMSGHREAMSLLVIFPKRLLKNWRILSGFDIALPCR